MRGKRAVKETWTYESWMVKGLGGVMEMLEDFIVRAGPLDPVIVRKHFPALLRALLILETTVGEPAWAECGTADELENSIGRGFKIDRDRFMDVQATESDYTLIERMDNGLFVVRNWYKDSIPGPNIGCSRGRSKENSA